MRAQFINEKFTEDSDAIHDMGIGSEWGRIHRGTIINPIHNVYMVKPTNPKPGENMIKLKFLKKVPYSYKFKDYLCFVISAHFENNKLFIESIPLGEKARSIDVAMQSDISLKSTYEWMRGSFSVDTWIKYFEIKE